jgi:hypothetical protein
VPHFFIEEILGEEGLHACLYLLAIDMEMEPLPVPEDLHVTFERMKAELYR